MINKLLGYREKQKKLFYDDPKQHLGDVTTINLTFLSGGVQMNVVPNELCVGFDMRITPTTNIAEFQKMLETWTEEVNDNNLVFLRGPRVPYMIDMLYFEDYFGLSHTYFLAF